MNRKGGVVREVRDASARLPGLAGVESSACHLSVTCAGAGRRSPVGSTDRGGVYQNLVPKVNPGPAEAEIEPILQDFFTKKKSCSLQRGVKPTFVAQTP